MALPNKVLPAEHKSNKKVDDYCVIDLETTTKDPETAAIIEIGAIKVRNNKKVDSFSQLINPQKKIPEDSTKIHGITDNDVKTAPFLKDVINEFLAFIKEDILLGYNLAHFDIRVINKNVRKLGISVTNDCVDLYHAVRRSPIKCILKNTKLETISSYYGLDICGEHRALKDCELTMACYNKLCDDYGWEYFKISSQKIQKKKGMRSSKEREPLNDLKEICKGILTVGEITKEKAKNLSKQIEKYREYSEKAPYNELFCVLDEVKKNDALTIDMQRNLEAILNDFIDPVHNRASHSCIKTFKENHFCITGNFSYGTRDEIKNLIELHGGIIDKSIKNCTNYLIVGNKNSEQWKGGNYGQKIIDAEEKQNKGYDIKIIPEQEFIRSIENTK